MKTAKGSRFRELRSTQASAPTGPEKTLRGWPQGDERVHFFDPGDLPLDEITPAEAEQVATSLDVAVDAAPTRETALGERVGNRLMPPLQIDRDLGTGIKRGKLDMWGITNVEDLYKWLAQRAMSVEHFKTLEVYKANKDRTWLKDL